MKQELNMKQDKKLESILLVIKKIEIVKEIIESIDSEELQIIKKEAFGDAELPPLS